MIIWCIWIWQPFQFPCACFMEAINSLETPSNSIVSCACQLKTNVKRWRVETLYAYEILIICQSVNPKMWWLFEMHLLIPTKLVNNIVQLGLHFEMNALKILLPYDSILQHVSMSFDIVGYAHMICYGVYFFLMNK